MSTAWNIFLALYIFQWQGTQSLFWKYLPVYRWIHRNEQYLIRRFRYLTCAANDRACHSVFDELVNFGIAVDHAVLLTFVRKIQDPISESKGDPKDILALTSIIPISIEVEPTITALSLCL